MSLFRPDLWFPEAVDYQVQVLTRPIFLEDYTASTLIATLFLGVQFITGGYIVRQFVLSRRLRRRRKGSTLGFRHQPSVFSNSWLHIGVTLVLLYTASVVLYWVAYGERYRAMTDLSDYKSREDVLQWMRDTPNHEGVKIICIPASSGPGGQEWCKTFKHTKNLLAYKGIETAFSIMVESIILLVDAILIFRFYMMFATSKYIFAAVGLLCVMSLTGPIMGFVALGKLASLGTASDPWWVANFPNDRFLSWHSPWIAVVLPVLVNVVVTIAIITRILKARSRLRELSVKLSSDNVYYSLTATLVESALPSALFGVLAAILHRAGKGDVERVKFSPLMLWVAFTALSPQFIIIRVLQGRAWNRQVAMSVMSSAETPLEFAHQATEDTSTSKTTVDPEALAKTGSETTL